MTKLRFTVYALLVSALLAGAACSKRQANQGSNTNAPADGPAQQQQGEPVSGDAREAFDRGMNAYRGNRDEDAVGEFKRAIELDPDFAEAHYRLGNAYSALGNKDEAEKAFRDGAKAYEKITRRAGKNSDAFYFLGLCYEKLGEWEDAVKALKEAVKTSPAENDDKYYELANAHFQLAQYDESVRALNKALEANPNNYPAQDLLEKSKAGAERVADFRKHQQEQMRKQQKPSNANSSNANSAANSNAPRPPAGTRQSDPLQPPPRD
ncbi:MAG TPA: tetratricopeptide repeat protein [Pyrinomonadaceae bacterium]|nr:tetratricopeptide repeat protein [Pyrinomonadaceae bacterium]